MMDGSKFEPITPARTRSRSPARSRSRSRSIRERLGRAAPSLGRVYSAQAFDDHAVYSRHNSVPNSPVEEHDTAHPYDGRDDASIASSRSNNAAKDIDLEKQETQELDQPEAEWDAGVLAERDFNNDTPKEELQKKKTREEQAKDPNLVTWDGPDDPANPKNWSVKRKWAATFVVSSFTFISPVSSSMVAPALVVMSKDLNITQEVESQMVLSVRSTMIERLWP
jgi:hypothetical protein